MAGWLVTVKSLPCNWPSYHATGVRGAVEVRPFPAKKRLWASKAQGLSGEAMKGNPTTTVIPGVDESKSSPRATEDLTEPVNLSHMGRLGPGGIRRSTLVSTLVWVVGSEVACITP